MKIDLHKVRRIVHGMTVGTNTILERKGARVALVTTKGFKDLLEIGRTQRNAPGSLFQIKFSKEKPLVPRTRRFEIQERLRYDGEVLAGISLPEVDQVSQDIVRCRAEAVAVCFLHSYINPKHEQLVKRRLAEKLQSALISASSEVVTEYREYERFSTTVLNCYLLPVMDRYLGSLEEELQLRGYRSKLFIMSSNGGACTAAQARALPVRTILSGPVGGVNGALFAAQKAGLSHMITYDMGGTSTDVCLIEDLAPVVSSENKIRGFPLKYPQVEINTVGAGGGSLARADMAGVITVGPESAGADPGPACYGKEGTEVTVTDANLYLNRLGAGLVLGGKIRLDRGLAEKALMSLSERLGGMDVRRLAEGIIQIAVAKMVSSIREISIEKGKDPRDYVLIPFGGAGPMHAVPIAEELQISRVFIPKYPGNLSAMGLLASDLKLDLVKTHLRLFQELQAEELPEVCRELAAQGENILMGEGFQREEMRARFSVDLRYLGQAFELNVPYEPEVEPMEVLRQRFYRAFREVYGHGKEAGEVQLINVRAAVIAAVPKPSLPAEAPGDENPSGEAGREVRDVYFSGQVVRTPVYNRESLRPGNCLEGPAIVEESGATIVIFPEWRGKVDPLGNVILTPSLSRK
ncbi:MAG: hydantoinase/oxoprolinase family protein [Candidatus Tectomicrobia bacterium]|uniref:Hydantoinase/oxoprolinase family protein n=1 Tax=Tectimicrobiota bacterium TaxID=2528274 RepID=A0A932GQX9_UNCTE|nr:hydantoinase/oxoprolinase family protein [Candidatus Tectomicrobia bacterium]